MQAVLIQLIIRRLLEPSTWAGLAGLWASLGLNPDPLSSIGNVVMAVLSAIAVGMPERAKALGIEPPGPRDVG